MIKVQIDPDEAGGYVLRVRDGANDNILLSSTTQSYENVNFVQGLARRLFVVSADQRIDGAEPVVTVTRFNTGGQATEQLR